MRFAVSRAGLIGLLLCACLAGAPAAAEVTYADYARAEGTIRQAESRIRLAEAAVGQALTEALAVRFDEPHDWSRVDSKMSELGKTLAEALPEISRQTQVILVFDPNYRNTAQTLGQPFAGNLQLVREQRRRILDLANDENARVAKLNAALAKVNTHIGQAAMNHMVDTMESFLPTQESLAGEAAIVTMTAILAPPMLVGATLAIGASAAFNSMTGAYLGLEGLAAQTAALASLKQVLLERKRLADANLKTLMDAGRALDALEQVLSRHQRGIDDYREQLRRAYEGLDSQSDEAYRRHRERLADEIRRRHEQAVTKLSMGDSSFCNDPSPDIQPSEFTGEADSAIAKLDSGSLAVEDGGDPGVYEQTESDWEASWLAKHTPLRKDYEKRSAEFSVKWQQCINTYLQSYYQAPNDEARLAAYRAWHGCVCPARRALLAPHRELTRQSLVYGRVAASAYSYDNRVQLAVSFRTREFWSELNQWRQQMGEAQDRVRISLRVLNLDFAGLRHAVEQLDEVTEAQLQGRENVELLSRGLRERAAELRRTGDAVKEALNAYAEAEAELMRVRNIGRAAIDSLRARYGTLLNHQTRYYFGRQFYGGETQAYRPDTARRDSFEASLDREVEALFRWAEPPSVKEARAMDWEALASRYEAKASELQFYVDSAEQYRYRHLRAQTRLSKIRLAVTPPSQAGAGAGPAELYVREEFSASPWAAFGREADALVDPQAYTALPWARVRPWSALPARQKLSALLSLLGQRVNEDMKLYIQSRRPGYSGFFPVPEARMKPIEAQWTLLKPLCQRFDELALAERNRLGTAAEDAAQAVVTVRETWAAMPALSRALVTEEHRRLETAYGWLSDYLTRKSENLQPLLAAPNQAVGEGLDELIGGYRPALAAWKKRQDEMMREAEANRLRAEAEEKARLAAEQAAAAERQRLQDTLPQEARAMYEDFRRAYEARDEAGVMRFLADGWEAGDGTRLSDLSATLRRTFNAFDEVRYELSNLQVQPGPGEGMVSTYDLTITSRIYAAGIRHVEKSSVREEVGRDAQGRLRILRTLGGRFWTIE